MAKLEQIIDILKQRFPDLDASRLEQTPAQRITGYVVSNAFEDQDHEERQHLLWQTLDSALPSVELRNVGPIVLMTFTEAVAHHTDY